MNEATRFWVGIVIQIVVAGGVLAALAKLLERHIERRWGKQDAREQESAGAQIKRIEADEHALEVLSKQIDRLSEAQIASKAREDARDAAWQKRFDENNAAWQKRFDEKELHFDEQLKQLRREVDEWREKYFGLLEKFAEVQSRLTALSPSPRS